ncbi:hypothetical protein An07g09980 [Aspergillus niger]|uniref:Uncharacterized protein n=2 Tax=Aspergillus niger TaxID=5061 RepID=A2QPM7_ASPNC|nr:hypothetical protein An07g09980 [Aspergillus niger]CAK45127.1 hypothetical protein An07g09980 [Aspergillus niger]
MNEEEWYTEVFLNGIGNRVGTVSRAARITLSFSFSLSRPDQFLSQGEIHLGGHWSDDWLPGVAISCSSRDGALPCIITTNGYEIWSTRTAATWQSDKQQKFCLKCSAAAVSQTTEFDRGEDSAAGVAGVEGLGSCDRSGLARIRRKEKNKNGRMENPSKFSEENERGETILSSVIMTASILPNSMALPTLPTIYRTSGYELKRGDWATVHWNSSFGKQFSIWR